MTRWAIFNVLVALVPLASGYFGVLLDGQKAGLAAVTARGELLLISGAIASSAIGELLPGGRTSGTRKLAAGGGCIVMVLLSSLVFAAVQASKDPDPHSIFVLSVWLFSATLLTSFGALYFAHEEEHRDL